MRRLLTLLLLMALSLIAKAEGKITLTTQKELHSGYWSIALTAEDAKKGDIWIDWNNNGVKDDGEADIDYRWGNTSEIVVPSIPEYGEMKLPKSNEAQQSSVTIQTSLPIGSKIKMTLQYDGEITLLGLEGNPVNGQEREYTTTAESILLKGSLTELHCTDALITALKLSNCSRLSVLDCSNNQIKSLDLHEAPHLEILICSNNQIASLNLLAIPDLSKLWCSNNAEIQSLDLSQATNLIALWCYGCSLSELDLSACTSLTGVDCTRNNLLHLSLGRLDYLTRVACGNNQLQELDLSGVPNMEELLCENNSLTMLKLGATPYLTTLKCANNLLSTLDLSSLQILTTLHCQGNLLSELDLSRNSALEEIYCYENRLKGDKMTALVSSLRKVPQGDYENLMLVNSTAPKEQNHPTVGDVAQAKAHGWTAKDYQGGVNDGVGVPFEGFNAIIDVTKGSILQMTLQKDRTLVISGAKTNPVSLYTSDGSILYCAESSIDGVHHIQIPYRTSSIMILHVGTSSYKLLVP